MSTLEEISPPAHEPVSIGEVRNYLRIEHDEEDALLAALIRTARQACELFLGKALITRDVRLRQKAVCGRFFLRSGPVQQLLALSKYDLSGETALSVADHPVEFGPDRHYLDIHASLNGKNIQADYRIGLGDSWNDVPEPIRQGILRLVAHQYQHRDDPGVSALPNAVTALWQPFRQVRI